MAQFVGMSTTAQVNGETVFSVVDGMGTYKAKALEILAENGIVDPKPGAWFPQQKWLDAFKKISELLGQNTLFSIGLKIPENAKFPPEIDTLEKALKSIDVAYHMNHRHGEIGHYNYESVGPKSAKMVCQNPFPCAFDRGIITAMAKQFKPKDSLMVNVVHDDSAPCRSKGGASCTYNVRW